MEALDWGALIIICIAGALSPGPSLLVIISITTRYGRLAGILGATGHGLAIFVYALTTALGVSWLSSSANQLFFYVQISGALLLLWMGLSMLISALISTLNSASKTSPVSENTYPPRKLGFAFTDGFLIGILNPKIAAFFASLFSQFVIPSQPLFTSLVMATTASLIDMAAYCMAALVANTLLVKYLFLNYARFRDCIFGLLLLILALSVIHNSFGDSF
jgi:threonine/homoserine/homoserine lactone efflux protein